QRLDHDAHLTRFPRLRIAARIGLTRRAAAPGSAQPQRTVARHLRLPDVVDHAVAADLHRRGDAGCIRPAENFPVSPSLWYKATTFLPGDHHGHEHQEPKGRAIGEGFGEGNAPDDHWCDRTSADQRDTTAPPQ